VKIFTTLTVNDLESLAGDLWFRLNDLSQGGAKRAWVNFTLRMAFPAQKYRGHLTNKYRARRPGNPAHWSNGAVCWHGHKMFLSRLFWRDPKAEVRTCQATYKGAESFEVSHEETGRRNVGSQAQPVLWRDCCDCEKEP
jgi:hypothetical protein